MSGVARKQKIIAIFIAYNAEKTLAAFFKEFPKHLVDGMILVDDASADNTFALAKKLGITAYRNPVNLGYGGNMKRALELALAAGADIIIDLHPDGEYKPSAIPAALDAVQCGAALVLGNRFMHGQSPLRSGMYWWKWIPIRCLNWIDRIALGVPLDDFHQGFRLYTRQLLEQVNYHVNDARYLFSFELIAQAVFHHLPIAQVPVETSYTGSKRGASLKSSIRYSLGTFRVLFLFFFAKAGLRTALFRKPRGVLRTGRSSHKRSAVTPRAHSELG
ncbi:MAG TPA: glycosyltransferase family 2 protein [Candidatus Nanoarchaeia archaeon]|nr:glycosyltransferase family 2 protein [Candidatus Nanoarchaeia archaeon]